MTPSQELIEHIKLAESFRAKPYMDQGSLAIGYGHHGSEVCLGLVWTEAQADKVLDADLVVFGNQVAKLVKVPLTQGQFDALVDFVYNLGAGRLQSSTLLRMLNKKEYAAAGQQFLRWNYVDGKPNDNLLVRRKWELEMWEKQGIGNRE